MDFIGTNDPTDIILEMISAITHDDISIYDLTAFLRRFFTQVRLFVLILNYNCFTHELQTPGVHLFF